MIRTEPEKKRLSMRLGASCGLPFDLAARWASSRAVTKVAMNVTQLTTGTAMDRSDFATRKLLKTEAA